MLKIQKVHKRLKINKNKSEKCNKYQLQKCHKKQLQEAKHIQKGKTPAVQLYIHQFNDWFKNIQHGMTVEDKDNNIV